MARIRTIKPEFWVSDQVANCSFTARLLFIGLWNFADDGGVILANPLKIKAQIFPYDSFSAQEIINLLNELAAQDLINFAQVDEKLYAIITGWQNHQKIDRPNKAMDLSHIDKSQIRRTFVEDSSNIRRALDESSRRNGKERKGKEGKGEEGNPLSTSSTLDKKKSIQFVFNFWTETMEHPKAKLDAKREKLISDAMKWGYDAEHLCKAIAGCSLTPHNMGQNDRGERYDGLHIILRSADQIDRFVRNSLNPPVSHGYKLDDVAKHNADSVKQWLNQDNSQDFLLGDD